MKKKLVSILLCLGLIGSLAGCQTASEKKNAEGAAAASTESSGATFTATQEQLDTLQVETIGEEGEFEGMKIAFYQRNIAGS